MMILSPETKEKCMSPCCFVGFPQNDKATPTDLQTMPIDKQQSVNNLTSYLMDLAYPL